jgi:hypothetical protein
MTTLRILRPLKASIIDSDFQISVVSKNEEDCRLFGHTRPVGCWRIPAMTVDCNGEQSVDPWRIFCGRSNTSCARMREVAFAYLASRLDGGVLKELSPNFGTGLKDQAAARQ